MTLLFWNSAKRENSSALRNLIRHHDVDILLLAECGASPETIRRSLNFEGSSLFLYFPGNCEKVQIFSRFPPGSITPVYESDRWTVRSISPPVGRDFLLASVHFPSKREWSHDSQLLECNSLSTSLCEAEANAGHSRTILLGDLNMNPFEAGVVGSRGLHATLSRKIAEKRGRKVQGKDYPFFYNPMWGRYGDSTKGPAGSYYHRRAEHVCYFWNFFDQCLVRPDLLYAFEESRMRILTTDGMAPLVSKSKGIPDIAISDHLPILVDLTP